MRFDYLADPTEKSLAPFFSPRMLSVTFNCIWILGVLLMVFWPKKGLFNFIEENEIPLVFLPTFVAALLINSYVNLRCGRGEMYPKDILYKLEGKGVTTFEEENDFFSYGLVESLLHTMFLLLLLLPMLLVSAGLSGISLQVFAKALSILFTSSLLCRLFGFLMYPCSGKWSLVGYLSIRLFFIFFMFVTVVFAPFANPILLINALYKGEEILSPSPMSTYAVYMMLVTAAILLFTLANQAIVRHNIHRERTT